MNKKQRIVLITTAVVLFIMLLFPPFSEEGLNEGYAFVFSPPGFAKITSGALLAQCLIVTVIGVLLCFAFKNSK